MGILTIIKNFWPAFLQGLLETVTIALFVWCLGIFIALLLTYISHGENSLGRKIIRISSFISTNIPVIILLMWAYYPLQEYIGFNISGRSTVIIVLTTVNSLSIASLISKALEQFPKTLVLTATNLGITKRAIFYKIKFPIILRTTFPAILAQELAVLHMTLFGSLISVDELFRTSQRIISQTYRPIQVYTALALFFLLIGIIFNLLVTWWKKNSKFLILNGEEC